MEIEEVAKTDVDENISNVDEKPIDAATDEHGKNGGSPVKSEEKATGEPGKNGVDAQEPGESDMAADEPVQSDIKSNSEISDLDSKIIRQVEYYFGNHNLLSDKFLKYTMRENDGWVPMETMMKFNRLKNICSDSAVVVAALKKSPNKLVEVSGDDTKIRRNPEKPLPGTNEELKKEVESRTLYVKGFKPQTTLDELLEFFKQYGIVENIYMRRKPNKKTFKGSIYATFATVEAAEAFMPMKNIKYKGTELLRERKAEYIARKNEWFQGILKEKEEKKKKREEKEKGVQEEGKSEEVAADEDITKGSLLKLSGLSETIMWEDIKKVMEPHGKVAYVDYSKGRPIAYVRFESGVASEVLDAVATEKDGVKIVKVKDADAVPVVLEGEEELKYWKECIKAKNGFKNRKQKGHHGKHGRFNQKGKRKRDDWKSGPSKRSKVDSD